jgi:hypothetical protein
LRVSMKLTIKDRIYSIHQNKFEFVITYKMGEWEKKEISFIKSQEEVVSFIIQLVIVKELSNLKRDNLSPYDYLCYKNKMENSFQWLIEVRNKTNHYYKYDDFVVYYYDAQGEKFKTEITFNKEILKKIKAINKEHKIGGINKWYKAQEIDYDNYRQDIEKIIKEGLIIAEKSELENALIKEKVKINKSEKKIKL